MILGVSSGSLPDLGVEELVRWTRRHGAACVDLRWGRRHRWEEAGLAAVAQQLPVVFLGLSLVLGRETAAAEADQEGLRAAGAVGVPVRCFLDAAVEHDPAVRARAASGAAALRQRVGVKVLVETHAGHASLPSLAELCQDTGARLVVDTLGLARTSGWVDPLPAGVTDLVEAVQVKGFSTDPPWRHRPLVDCAGVAAATGRLLDGLPTEVPVTVETRCGQPELDLEWLQRRGGQEAGCAAQ